MSIRRRSWTTSRGEAREGWVVDFRDTQGRRRSKAFKRKQRDATAYAATAAVEVAAGVHVVVASARAGLQGVRTAVPAAPVRMTWTAPAVGVVRAVASCGQAARHPHAPRLADE